jgi:NAD-dependent dihydropyrimidine dehydrogenase PreA subunit
MTRTKNTDILGEGREKSQDCCVVRNTLDLVTEFLDSDMCGRCMPCALGSHEMKIRLQKLTNRNGSCEDLDAIRKVAVTIRDSALCVKGKKTARNVIDLLETSISHYYEHIDGKCSFFRCSPLYVYKIIPDRCNACSECRKTCEYDAIVGEKSSRFFIGCKPFEIISQKCVRCGACMEVCPTEAILPSHELIDNRF